MDQLQDKHQKEYSVIVNGREKKVAKETLTFSEIVALAFDNPPTGPDVVFTVSWRHGQDHGTVVEGGTVEIRNGMIFNVTSTNKS